MICAGSVHCVVADILVGRVAGRRDSTVKLHLRLPVVLLVGAVEVTEVRERSISVLFGGTIVLGWTPRGLDDKDAAQDDDEKNYQSSCRADDGN